MSSQSQGVSRAQAFSKGRRERVTVTAHQADDGAEDVTVSGDLVSMFMQVRETIGLHYDPAIDGANGVTLTLVLHLDREHAEVWKHRNGKSARRVPLLRLPRKFDGQPLLHIEDGKSLKQLDDERYLEARRTAELRQRVRLGLARVWALYFGLVDNDPVHAVRVLGRAPACRELEDPTKRRRPWTPKPRRTRKR